MADAAQKRMTADELDIRHLAQEAGTDAMLLLSEICEGVPLTQAVAMLANE